MLENRVLRCLLSYAAAVAGLGLAFAPAPATAQPKVVLISLDGATPHLVHEFMRDGAIPPHKGLGLLARRGVSAERNVTVDPSLTAPGHVAIATGSTAARNDVLANTFHLVASPFFFPNSTNFTTISGFGAPIGGYSYALQVPAEAIDPTAEPLWVALRAAGKRVVTATWPGGDGVDVRVPGLPAGSPVIQSAGKRTVDFTVPFGAFGGAGAQGFVLTDGSFEPAPQTTVDQLTAAGQTFFGPVMQTKAGSLLTFNAGGVAYSILAAALDTTNDGQQNYDTLVFFDPAQGIKPGPFTLPSTGPAYVKASDRRSGRFYLEGSSNRAGTAFYVSLLEPDLSLVHVARYSANFIPRNTVGGDVDDIHAHVGFWAPQADFRIPERLSPGFDSFSDLELEAIYADQVATFVDYQTRVALRGLERIPDADLAMIYIEQPDGSGHQFLLVDPRQPSDPKNPTSIGAGQDPAKKARYRQYLRTAYKVANEAVHRIIEAVGIDNRGRPKANVIVVSDHGFAPFHTAVNLNAYLAAQGFDPKKVRAVTSGPAANVYINLQGREPDGTVPRTEYLELQRALVKALRELEDENPNYARHHREQKVFDRVVARPTPRDMSHPDFGLGTSRLIGQDSGDVYARLAVGYNFDGTQSPVVIRLGDTPPTPPAVPVLSVPNFYGAHGYDPQLPEMSAIFFAAGPDACRGELERVRNIDVTPTILKLLDVKPAETVEGRPIDLCPRRGPHHDRDD